MKLKIISILLVLVMIALAACSDPGNGIDNSSSPSTVSETSGENSGDESSAESSVDEFDDGLPNVNFNGRTYTILQRSEFKYEFTNDGTASDKVQTLIAERNRKVEERFGVTIKTIEQEGIWGKHVEFMQYVRNTIDSGTAEYDIIAGYAAIMPSLISEGYFVNWYDMDEYINFEKDWWSQDFISELTLNGKLYLLSGDISLTFWDSMQCIFYNKTLADSYNVNNLYELVTEGKWTFDQMFQIIKNTHVEDSDPEREVYGYATFTTVQIDVYQDAFDIPVTEKDGEGKPVFTINQSKTYDALNKLFDLIVDTPYTKICKDENGNNNTVEFFGEGRALFAPLCLADGATLQNYDTIYGILPMPKFNEQQDNYHTTCRDSYSVMAVPTSSAFSTENLDFIAIITEALCVESSRSVVPEYYTLVLKERYTKDEESIEMIDIIRKGILCNFGYLYSYTLDWPAHQLNVCINNKIKDFASRGESLEDNFNANLAEAIKFYFED